MELYDHGTTEGVLVLAADGGLDHDTAEDFVDEIVGRVEQGTRRLIVDCSHLHRITSYGLGVLLRLHRKFAGNGGRVKLASVDGLVVEILDRTGLAKRFEIYRDLEHALAAFRHEDAQEPAAAEKEEEP